MIPTSLCCRIVNDLFPGVAPIRVDRTELKAAIDAACAEMGLQASTSFKLKALQLYDTVQVRHGLMMVGLPYSGKTAVYKVLARALTLMSAEGKREARVRTYVVYPKALGSGHLYGEYEALSHEWTDGVLAVQFRKAANAWPEVQDRHWIVLDGPVDAIWIEDMNTGADSFALLHTERKSRPAADAGLLHPLQCWTTIESCA